MILCPSPRQPQRMTALLLSVIGCLLLLLLLHQPQGCRVAALVTAENNVLFSLPINGNEPEIAYFWNAAQILREADELELVDTASRRLYRDIDGVIYAREAVLHGGDTRFERVLTNATWVFKRTRPATWHMCDPGPFTVGGSLHAVEYFVNGSSAAVLVLRDIKNSADPFFHVWVYHDCRWFDVTKHHPRAIGTFFPATAEYSGGTQAAPLRFTVFFGGCVRRIFRSRTSLRDECPILNTNNTFTLLNTLAVLSDWHGQQRAPSNSGSVWKTVTITADPITGTAPTGRRLSGMTYHDGAIYFFGGESADAVEHCDLWRIDSSAWETQTWDTIESVTLQWQFLDVCTKEGERPKFNIAGNSVMTTEGRFVYMLGSANLQDNSGPLIVLAWDTVQNQFKLVASEDVQRPAWPVEFAHFNVPRGALASLVSERATGILFGDFSGLRTGIHSTVWEFTTFLNSDAPDILFVPVPNINRPTPKVGHTFNLHRDNELLVFGGSDGRINNEVWLFIFDNSPQGKWVYVPPADLNVQPAPRFFHSSAIVGNGVVVFGGTDAQEFISYNDFWYLEIRNDHAYWTRLTPSPDSQEWQGTSGAAYTCRRTSTPLFPPPNTVGEVRCLAFGGQREQRPHDDLMLFQFFIAADGGPPVVRVRRGRIDVQPKDGLTLPEPSYPSPRVHGAFMRDLTHSRYVLLGGRSSLRENLREHIVRDAWLFEFDLVNVVLDENGAFTAMAHLLTLRHRLDPNGNDEVQPEKGYYDILCPVSPNSSCSDDIALQLSCYMPTDPSDAKWLMYGGRRNTNVAADVWEFDFKLFRFTLLEATLGAGVDRTEVSRWGHSCMFSSDHMIAFGGVGNNNNYLNSVLAMKPTCNAGWRPNGRLYANSTCVPCRNDFFFQAGVCRPCPENTLNEGKLLLESTCNVCTPSLRRRCRGKCHVDNDRPNCICSDLRFGERCQYSIIAVILLPVLAIIGVGQLIFVLYRRHRRVAAANEALEQLLGDVHEELASLEKVFEIDMKDITLIKRIDTNTPGAMGDVYKAKYNNKVVALKRLKAILIEDDNDESLREFQEETLFLRGIRHANIVFFYGAGVDPTGVPFLVTDFCERGSLAGVIHDPGFELTLARKLGFLLDAARGMSFLHGLHPPRVHGDLKSANLLVAEDWTVQIADFGTSCLCDRLEDRSGSNPGSFRDRTTSVTRNEGGQWKADVGALGSTPRWSAPEVIRRDGFLLASDVYAFGMVMYELEARCIPFPDVRFNNEVETLVLEGQRPQLPDAIQPFFETLMTDCWAQSATQRPSFSHILQQLQSEYNTATIPSKSATCQESSF
eukprot:m.24815 g.24815  ORF g.24815 m.24815 type:complete len:1318 (-) comp9751_c0_seq1:79-4032(-)